MKLAATELPAPPASLTLKKIAVGHGIQNYSCPTADSSAPTQLGALAVLYDVTSLYPGTPKTGINETAWTALPTTILWSQPLPLNLVNEKAASPGTPSQPNVLPEASYGADTSDPFPRGTDLQLSPSMTLKFLGHHFFDISGTPTFDLSAAGLKGSVVKTGAANAPAGADKGILNTGAVAWLQLSDSGKGLSSGISMVYRVITAGGAAQACSTSGAGQGSVPYTAFYWFYG
jgi:hypothetical protein